MEYIPETEVAKMAKKLLKQAFPNQKFSVRTDKYSMGSSINVNWTLGISTKKAEAIVGHLHGSTFDAMQDLKENNGKPYANDYIFCNRRIPDDFFNEFAVKVAARFGHTITANQVSNYRIDDRCLTEIVWREIQNTDF